MTGLSIQYINFISCHKQAAESHELKRWLMSQLKDRDVQIPAKGKYYRLLSSTSVEQSVTDTDLESAPLLSGVSGDSSTSLTYVNILPSESAYSLAGLKPEQMGGKKHFEMRVDRSAGTVCLTISSTVQSKDHFKGTFSCYLWWL